MTGFIARIMTLGFCAFLTLALTGCGPDYSPNTYNGSAMQQANKVDTGIVVGFREVRISDDGTVGVVTGGAAGGILGAEMSSPTVPTALAALGGTVVGGVLGSTIQHATGDTTGWEYIVREPKGELISVTQREPKPIAIGQKVLVIEGKQARIVPDYSTAAFEVSPAPKAEEKHDQDKSAAPNSATATTATSATSAAATAPSPPTSASPSAPASAPDNTAATPSSAVKDQTPNPTPPAAQAVPPPAAETPAPPASAGSSNSTPPAPPS